MAQSMTKSIILNNDISLKTHFSKYITDIPSVGTEETLCGIRISLANEGPLAVWRQLYTRAENRLFNDVKNLCKECIRENK